MRTFGALLSAGAVALGAVLAGPAPAAADHPGDVDCRDFTYQEDAQAHLDAHPGDPDRLDGSDDDGRACEALPSRPAPAPAPEPAAEPCVYGAIGARWASLGGADGFLGPPLTCELPTPAKAGRYNHFHGGSIYWSAPTGAWEVHGRIRDKWAALGWENGFLGFPLTDENRLRGGAFSRFQGGHVYWSPATGAHEVHGAIFDTWGRFDWENGSLGYPLTDELPTPDKPGRYNHFQGGSVYWSPTTGAFPLDNGPIRDAWAGLGWENSTLGFPTSTPYAVVAPDGEHRTRQDFQGGVITWSPTAGAVVGTHPGGDGDGPGDVTAAALLAALQVAPEDPGRYDRDLFPHWSDADGDGCDTRDEVLIVQSQTPVRVGAGCSISDGRWFSYYDAATWSDPADLQIDHVVALSEAWDSGAHRWTTERREAFANDLGFGGSLQAVTGAVNQAKGAKDPAQWLPPVAAGHCTYAVSWVAVKWRWGLTVDTAERDRLGRLLSGPCGQREVQVTLA